MKYGKRKGMVIENLKFLSANLKRFDLTQHDRNVLITGKKHSLNIMKTFKKGK